MIFYHGSSVLFPNFDLSHALEGDGKVKFGYGVYLTSSIKSAAHYSETKSRPATTHYVYTVEVPDLTEDNHIDFKKPVHPEIIKRAEQKLGHLIPEKFTLDGKDFRKFLAKNLGGGLDIQSEKKASEFLNSIGVEFITYPYNWKKSIRESAISACRRQSVHGAEGKLTDLNPGLGLNVAVLDDSKIKIIKIHQVVLDQKKKLIPGSEKEVKI